jgi:tetraacyldisaccharide 4'-kinase
MLARRFSERGSKPAILTRGYKRRSPEQHTILPAGTSAPVSVTGDEAQILLREGVAALGIGKDRLATGRILESQFHPDVVILDDGFQHAKLERDVDIVLLDGLDPLAGGDLFPVGRQREPVDALSRAGIFVITRADQGNTYAGLRRVLATVNATAPIFFSRVQPEYWVDFATGSRLEPDGLREQRVAGFCGLANPASFWKTLAMLGYKPGWEWAFGDHHVYRHEELRQIAARAVQAGANVLLTTEKDAMNLPRDVMDRIAPLGLYWLKIGTVLEDEEQFLDLLNPLAFAKRRDPSPAGPVR